ncbi:hypothetical protein C8R42DRAFT_729624 [Lentinula raphanica]|nr:hypothetical protein C8R42DRAFT_729624 [Lentinula raphanica]
MYSTGKRKRTHLELLQQEYQYLSSEPSAQTSVVEAEIFPPKSMVSTRTTVPTMSSLPSSPTNIDNMLVDGDDLHTLAPITAGTDWSRFTQEVIDDMVDHVLSEFPRFRGNGKAMKFPCGSKIGFLRPLTSFTRLAEQLSVTVYTGPPIPPSNIVRRPLFPEMSNYVMGLFQD